MKHCFPPSLGDYKPSHTQSQPMSQNWSPKRSSTNTPTKRDTLTIDLDDLPITSFITPKQSATKAKQIIQQS